MKTNQYDKNIFSIIEIKEKMEKQVKSLTNEFNELTREAKIQLKVNRALAKQTLKKRALVIEHLGKRNTTYNNILKLFRTISSSIENNMVVDFYKICKKKKKFIFCFI